MAESQQVTGHRPQPVRNGGLWTVNGSPIQTMKRKILSALIQTLALVALGFVAYWLTFASQF